MCNNIKCIYMLNINWTRWWKVICINMSSIFVRDVWQTASLEDYGKESFNNLSSKKHNTFKDILNSYVNTSVIDKLILQYKVIARWWTTVSSICSWWKNYNRLNKHWHLKKFNKPLIVTCRFKAELLKIVTNT